MTNTINIKKNTVEKRRAKIKSSLETLYDLRSQEEAARHAVDRMYDKYDIDRNITILERKYEMLGGLLDEDKLTLFIDNSGKLTLAKIKTDLNGKKFSYFDGWKVGCRRVVLKNSIICPSTWVRLVIVKDGYMVCIVDVDGKSYKISQTANGVEINSGDS